MCLPLTAPKSAMLSDYHEFELELEAYTGWNRGLTWDQRMHAIHRYELFCQGIGDAVVVYTRAWNAANVFTGF